MSKQSFAGQAKAEKVNRPIDKRVKYAVVALVAAIVAYGSFLVARSNYVLFHAFVDGISSFIAASVFFVVWKGRRRLDNHYYLLTGIGFLFFAFLDFVHFLATKNMGVFPGLAPNLTSTLYIASRYVLSVSLALAPLFIKRRLNTGLAFAVYSLATVLIMLSIFSWKIFPVTFVDGVGLTPFKIISDYIVCLILLGAIGLLLLNRRAFDPKVLKTLVFALILSIATGLAFTLYTDPFGITNMVGHFFQIGSFYLVYVTFVDTALTKPQDILYRELKQSEERFNKAFYSSPAALSITRIRDGTFIDINESYERLMGYTRDEIIGSSPTALNIYLEPGERDEMVRLLAEKGRVRERRISV